MMQDAAIENAGEELAMWIGLGDLNSQKNQIATSTEINGGKVSVKEQ